MFGCLEGKEKSINDIIAVRFYGLIQCIIASNQIRIILDEDIEISELQYKKSIVR